MTHFYAIYAGRYLENTMKLKLLVDKPSVSNRRKSRELEFPPTQNKR